MSATDTPPPTAKLTPGERAHLRRGLLQLASLLLLTLLASGLLALFAVWSVNHAHRSAEATLINTDAAIDANQRAQYHFKLQVQEWKNLLIRGGNPVDRATYVEAFNRHEADVQNDLTSAEKRLADMNARQFLSDIQALRVEHANLGEKYRLALGRAPDRAFDGEAIDRSVRGIDRPLDQHFDQQIERLLEWRSGQLSEVKREAESHFTTLTHVLWSALLIALGVVSTLLWRILGSRSLAT